MTSHAQPIWTLPNLLSIARAILTVPAVLAIIHRNEALVLAIGVIASATDFSTAILPVPGIRYPMRGKYWIPSPIKSLSVEPRLR